MSQANNDKMPQEVDFTGGVRGKYLARYQRWAGLTTAAGPIELTTISTGDPLAAKIVGLTSFQVMLASHHGLHSGHQTSRIMPLEAVPGSA